MGRLPEQFDLLQLFAVPGQRLELEGELGVQLAARQHRPLVSGLPDAGSGTGLGTQGLSGMIGLLRLLLFILAGAGDGIHAGPGGGGGLDLGGIVRL